MEKWILASVKYPPSTTTLKFCLSVVASTSPRRKWPWPILSSLPTSESQTSNFNLSLPGCFKPLNLCLSSNSGFVQLLTVLVWNFSSSSFFSLSFTTTYLRWR